MMPLMKWDSRSHESPDSERWGSMRRLFVALETTGNNEENRKGEKEMAKINKRKMKSKSVTS
jgi:hypothetical protein